MIMKENTEKTERRVYMIILFFPQTGKYVRFTHLIQKQDVFGKNPCPQRQQSPKYLLVFKNAFVSISAYGPRTVA